MQLFERFGDQLGGWVAKAGAEDKYLPWDQFRFRPVPEGLSAHEWWGLTMAHRSSSRHPLPFLDLHGKPFHYSRPDVLMSLVESLTARTSGLIATHEPVTNEQTRDRHIVRSLMEEAITSSQLEGAATTRQVAKEMLRTARKPATKGEQMIVNNYQAMELIREQATTPLTVELVLELHRVLTLGTLDDPDDAGRIQTPEEHRVHVGSMDEVLHMPPAAEELPGRLEAIIAFANGDSESSWLPKLLRPIALHFMMGHDHFFVDGNGRLARALFYWSMLREGFWVAQFISISQFLHAAPAQYGRAYLNTEHDSDLTYFFLFHLGVLRDAVDALENYLQDSVREATAIRARLDSLRDELNHRQIAVLGRAAKDPAVTFSVQSHAHSQRVTAPTAQRDLEQLAELGYLTQGKQGRRYVWRPSPDLPQRLG